MMDLFKFNYRIAGIFLSLLLSSSAYSAALKSAVVTAIVNDVSVTHSGKTARPAQLDETISGQSSVQTGLKSRTELLFSDKTMARLGANSTFSFTNGTRDIDLKQGTMFLQVPKGAGGTKITTEAVTCAITGTTTMIEYFPGGFTKVIVLEGTLRLFLNNRVGESTLLAPGKMVILNPNSKEIPEPVDVDIKRLVKTSKLIQAIDGTNIDLKIVEGEIANQEKQKKKRDLIGTNLVITGSGTEVILASQDLLNTLQNAAPGQQEILQAHNGSGNGPGSPNASSSPYPTKYSPATTIRNSGPYGVITTTKVVTAPSITTGSVTSQGAILATGGATIQGFTYPQQVSGGTLTLTVSNSSQILTFLNSAPPGMGGNITFTSAGGKIDISGEVNAGHKSQTGTSGSSGLLTISNNTSDGKINIANTAILRADVIKAEVLGTNGTLTINGGGAGGLTADSQIKLMANQSTGNVLFTGGVVNLTAPTILVNANTVTVTGDTRVNNNGATTVGAVNHNYTNGVGPTGLGGFRDPVTQTAP